MAAYVCVEISCSPNGDEKYPVPTKLRIARIFGSAQEAAAEFGEDVMYRADPEYAGQDIYFVLWKTNEPLNLDRFRAQDNSLSNCGMWLPDSERVYGATDLAVELVPPARIRSNATPHSAENTSDETSAEKRHSRLPMGLKQGQYGTRRSGTPWKKFM